MATTAWHYWLNGPRTTSFPFGKVGHGDGIFSLQLLWGEFRSSLSRSLIEIYNPFVSLTDFHFFFSFSFWLVTLVFGSVLMIWLDNKFSVQIQRYIDIIHHAVVCSNSFSRINSYKLAKARNTANRNQTFRIDKITADKK